MWTKTGGNAVRARGSEKAGEKIEERKRKDKGTEEYVGFADRSSIATFIIDTEALEEPIPLPYSLPPSVSAKSARFFLPAVSGRARSNERSKERACFQQRLRQGRRGGEKKGIPEFQELAVRARARERTPFSGASTTISASDRAAREYYICRRRRWRQTWNYERDY